MVNGFLGIKINFKGKGVNEIGFVTGIEGKAPKVESGQIIKMEKRCFRPSK